MIKKIIFIICFLLMAQMFFCCATYADEILDAKGNITPCKIETVVDGFIEYHKDGNLYTFARSNDSQIFNDYVDVRLNLTKKNSFTRHTGKIIAKDMWGVILNNENGNVNIPWYRVKFVGIYKP